MTVRTVTVGGLPGTGSSTLCRLLERDLGLPWVYAGQLFRQEAARRGMSLAQLNELSQRDETVDRALDDHLVEWLRAGGVILEGRMAGWLARRHGVDAFTVWVVCDLHERVARLVRRDGGDVEEQRRATVDRERREADRYRRYYGADPSDPAAYDLVVDSTSRSPAELADAVADAVRSRGNGA